jgi:signal transduction histidine kinase
MSSAVDHGARRADRTPLIRHLALCVAALLAFVLRDEPRVENTVLWVVMAAAVLNLIASVYWHRPRLGPVARVLSSILGLAGWSALAALTGGLASPLIAGLWLEIVLAAMTGPLAGIPLTTAGAVTGLWTQQSLLGLEGETTEAVLLTGFLLLVGGLTFHLAQRWRWSELGMERQIVALREQLTRLESELGPGRVPGERAHDTARLAHGLKNTVHSMRGLIQLIEPQLRVSGRSQKLLDGLRFAIDSLEQTARVTLGPAGPRGGGKTPGECVLTPRDVREVVRQVAAAFPGVRWNLSLDAMPPAPSPTTPILRDALINVLRNAAEAMQGQGEVLVDAAPRDGRLEIRVRDRGPGLSPDLMAQVFEPGRTTKAAGHGLGLFLARQDVEAGGGRLTLSPAEGGGMLCSLDLPLPGPQGVLARARG